MLDDAAARLEAARAEGSEAASEAEGSEAASGEAREYRRRHPSC